MERHSKILYHSDVLETIDEWSKVRKGKMCRNGSLLDGIEAELSPYKKAFKLEFEESYRTGTRLLLLLRQRKLK